MRGLRPFLTRCRPTSTAGAAVAVAAGASADAAYSNDVAVFTMAIGGLMYEATIGGQKFSYSPN